MEAAWTRREGLVLAGTRHYSKGMSPEYPCIGFFPALPLKRTLVLGDWMVGGPPDDTPWRSARFRELAETLHSSFSAFEFQGGAMLWHRERGFDGTPPSSAEIDAIRAAVGFAVLDANDRLFGHRGLNPGDYLATAENGELYLQPIDEEAGGVTHLKDGALRKRLTGGWKIGEKSLPLPDAVFPIAEPVPASTKLAKAVFDALMAPGSRRPGRMSIAMEWHRAAMANPRAVTAQQRLIALKTGFEGLLGASESRKCATRLRKLFETTTAAHRDLLPWAGVLWSPKEKTDLKRLYTSKNGKKKQDTRSEIEDWFMTLADARNSIIHDGVLSVDEYGPPPERPLSRYTGKLFWIGERLLRETVKATLGPEILLCGCLAERAAWKKIFETVEARRTRSAEPPPPAQTAPATNPKENVTPTARDLQTLLHDLGCQAANQVMLSPAQAQASASQEAAAEMAAAVQDLWEATAGGVSIAITTAERDLLEQAGAEMKLPDYFTACE